MAKTDKVIDITDIQAIEHVRIPIPEGGGVVVLRGDQGTGKSTAIAAVQTLAGRKADNLSIRDGAKRGTIECDGCRVVITKSRAARSGELAFEMIESRFDLSVIVDPQIKDEDRADALRIKQLLALTGAKPNVDAYWDLLKQYLDQDEIDDLQVDDETDDPLVLHKTFVQAMQAAARSYERKASSLRVDVEEIKRQFQGLNIRKPPSVENARTKFEEATVQLQHLENVASQADKQRAATISAREQLTKLESDWQGGTADDCRVQLQIAEQHAAASYQQMIEAERNYKDAKRAVEDHKHRVELAEHHEQAIATAKAVLESAMIARPSHNEMERAAYLKGQLGKIFEDAVRANEGAEQMRLAEERNFLALKAQQVADDLRDKAQARAEEILAETLQLSHIKVQGTRLVVDTDRSSEEPFAELSHGERAILAIREAAKHVPPHGLCSVSQEVWSGISDANKARLRAEAVRLGITILTAEVTDGALKAEVMP